MKKNILFLGSFFCILFGTIFYQKNLVEDLKVSQEKQKQVFSVDKWGKLTFIELVHNKFKMGTDGKLYFTDNNSLVDPLMANRLMRLLSHVKMVRTIEVGEQIQKISLEDEQLQRFFTHSAKLTFFFERGRLECVIGDKQAFSQAFYMLVKKQRHKTLIVAKIDLPLEGIFTPEQRRTSSFYYDQLFSLLTASPRFFINHSIIDHKLLSQIEQVHFVADNFSIDIKGGILNPPPLPGIEVAQKEIKNFIQQLASMRGSEVYPDISPDRITSEVQKLKVTLSDASTFTLYLVRKFQGKVGWFLYNEYNHALYIVPREVSRLFFVHAQQFWQRAVITKVADHFSLANQQVSLDLQYMDGHWVLVDNLKRSVSQEQVRKLVKFLRRQADMVELTVPSIKQQKNLIFKINILNHQLAVLKSSGDLIFWDQTRSLVFHYWIGDQVPFDEYIENYLE